MQFIDEAKIFIQSGKGGDGATSFRREKFVPQGGPDGGDGGRGASVIFIANSHLNTLLHFRYKQHFKAEPGQNGMGKNRYGKAGEDLIVEVPVGTQIFDETSSIILYDFTKDGQEFKILNGGRGGLGNSHFKSSINQAPERSTKGGLGSEMWVWLKLKLISDCGLVGMPNAGKSTFLSKVTSAKPKIADYPFTTLKPSLGVVRIYEDEFVLADIPGLIKGAHEGSGLGDKFLKAIERCGVIIHLIDIGVDDVIETYEIIRKELESYSDLLAKKRELICLNKSDSVDVEEMQEKVAQLANHTKENIFVISAAGSFGLDDVIKKAWEMIQEFREEQNK
ncbi:MAG: GTPase ObgE [Rickettsiaceae bacterium]|nr:GTPase ObgE [Rickettsiaceae bacterium]